MVIGYTLGQIYKYFCIFILIRWTRLPNTRFGSFEKLRNRKLQDLYYFMSESKLCFLKRCRLRPRQKVNLKKLVGYEPGLKIIHMQVFF